MFCINCFNPKTNVSNSRPHKKSPSIWRRRSCSACGISFTTHERPTLRDNQIVHHSSGLEEPFNTGKLFISIAAALTHDDKSRKYSSWWLTETVEQTLASEVKVLTPEDIAAVTHQVLRRFDELAAMQYAAQQGLIGTKNRGR